MRSLGLIRMPKPLLRQHLPVSRRMCLRMLRRSGTRRLLKSVRLLCLGRLSSVLPMARLLRRTVERLLVANSFWRQRLSSPLILRMFLLAIQTGLVQAIPKSVRLHSVSGAGLSVSLAVLMLLAWELWKGRSFRVRAPIPGNALRLLRIRLRLPFSRLVMRLSRLASRPVSLTLRLRVLPIVLKRLARSLQVRKLLSIT